MAVKGRKKDLVPAKVQSSKSTVSTPSNSNVAIVRLNFFSYDVTSLNKFVDSFSQTLKQQGIPFSGPILMPVVTKSLTLLRSVFIYKKSKEHFAMSVHRRMFEIDADKLNLSMFRSVVLPACIAVKIKRVVKNNVPR